MAFCNSGEFLVAKVGNFICKSVLFYYAINSLMEFFYIIEGIVLCESGGTRTELKEKEYFYVQNLTESAYFKALTDVVMLYVTSQPVFHLLSNEIEKLMEMMNKVEEKDMYTHGHGSRLSDFSIKIGEKMNLPKKNIAVLYYAALFHDIGKIHVPDEILKKPGKLTSEEFECIKKHPLDGEEIIVDTFLKESIEGIVKHHERLDGSGYPFGLKEDEIPIEAKIIAVVDTYDAMTSDRPYRKGMDASVALKEIKSLIGKHYDRTVVECLEEILEEEGVI